MCVHNSMRYIGEFFFLWGINSQKIFKTEKAALQTFYNGEGICGPVYVYLQVMPDKQRAGSREQRAGASQVGEITQLWKTILKGRSF